MKLLRIAPIVFFTVISTVWGATQTQFYPTDGEILETNVQVQVNGESLSLNAHRIWECAIPETNFMDVAAGRFAANGPIQVSMQLGKGALSPQYMYGLENSYLGQTNGSALVFNLPGPGTYWIPLPSLAAPGGTFTLTLWVDDLGAVQKDQVRYSESNVVNVTNKGIVSSPTRDQTAALTTLLSKGGTFCFPPGIYSCSTLYLKSNTTIYLAPGTRLLALSASNAIPTEFICVRGINNVEICGEGTIDANSLTILRPHHAENVKITSSQNVSLHDVLVDESNDWGVDIEESENVTVDNVKVLSGSDGFDPDTSRNVLIDGAFIASGDDSVSVKNRYPGDPYGCTNVVIKNSIVGTTDSALGIGTETYGPIENITFSNCDVFNAGRAVELRGDQNGAIANVTWTDIRAMLEPWPDQPTSGIAFYLERSDVDQIPPVNILVQNLTGYWYDTSRLVGGTNTTLHGLTLTNITAEVQFPYGDKVTGLRPILRASGNVNVPIANFTVDWNGNQSDWWEILNGSGVTLTDLLQNL